MVAQSIVSPLVVIVGATATGKTDLAIKLAKEFGGEIVSADSWLVRREANIGTAKPKDNELKEVRHHMIDVISPCEDYSAARYKLEASNSLDDIWGREKLPILVGGTGLYIDSILYNYSFLPASSPETRNKLNSMTLKELIKYATHKGLPLNLIDQRNKRRVIRLIETEGEIPKRGALRNNTLIIGLSATKDQQYERIENRVQGMIDNGLEEEVYYLSKKYGWDCEALKGIGYHEWKLYFEGSQMVVDIKKRIIKDTLMLAKRQNTWFKRNKSIHWLATPVKYAYVDELVTTFLSKNITKS